MKVALALGSGGARGYAHIGVLQVLQERGIEVACVAGTSMGALVGGMYAAGKLDDFTAWGLALKKQFDVIRLMDPAPLGGPGMIRANRVLARISDLLEGVLIEDLPIKFTAVATDLGARREVWFQSGPLDVAIRSSIAIPSVITPVMVGGRLLVDGGVANPVPIEPTLATPVDFTIAVELSGTSRDRAEQRTTPVHADAGAEGPAWMERFRKQASELFDPGRFRALNAKVEPSEPAADQSQAYRLGPLPRDLTMIDLVSQSIDAMGGMITRYRLASNPPDVLISVPFDACKTMDFHRAQPMIELGRQLAEDALRGVLGHADQTTPQA